MADAFIYDTVRTPRGRRLATSDGGVFGFGDAGFHGSAADLERSGLGLVLDPNGADGSAIRAAAIGLMDGPGQAAAAALGEGLRADPGPKRARRAVVGSG